MRRDSTYSRWGFVLLKSLARIDRVAAIQQMKSRLLKIIEIGCDFNWKMEITI